MQIDLNFLQRFCSKLAARGESPHYLANTICARPFKFDGHVYATNQIIGIRVPASSVPDAREIFSPEILTNEEIFAYWKEKLVKLSALFRHERNCALPIPPLPEPVPCQWCEGTGIGYTVKCTACNGDGYGCDLCDGTGEEYAGQPREDGKPCWHCSGYGQRLHQPIAIGNANFNRAYLALAADLPGARFVHIDDKGPSHLVFDGGEIAIMPTRF